MELVFQGGIDDNIYSCYSNLNIDELIYKICKMEGVEDGFVLVFGMLVVFVSMAVFLKVGDYVLVFCVVFGLIY